MNQHSRPESDMATGLWTPTPVYAELDERTVSDASKVTSDNNPNGDRFEVRLAALKWPESGAQKPTGRMRKVGSGAIVRMSLLQGSQLIATNLYSASDLTTSFADKTLTLTSAEKALITDYTNLRVEFRAGVETVSESCGSCSSVPKCWLLKVAGVTNNSCNLCGEYNGEWKLTHDGGCIWGNSEKSVDCGGAGIHWNLIYEPTDDRWRILREGISDSLYALDDDDWDCLGVNVMNYDTNNTDCNWPSTVTVEPF